MNSKDKTFRITCPDCKASHDALEENIGMKFFCSCGQKLQVPHPPRRRKWREDDRSHSILGMISMILGAIAFIAFETAYVIYLSWVRGLSDADILLFDARRQAGLPMGPALPSNCGLVMIICLIAVVVALIIAGCSFIPKTKRHWCIAACSVNGFFLLFLLLQL